jgi:hypothetical protein
MTQRVTRQYVALLGPGSGTLRVTRQYLSVVLSVISPVVLDSFTLNETVDTGGSQWLRSVNDSLTASDTGINATSTASDLLVFEDEPILYFLFPVDPDLIGDVLTLNEVIVGDITLSPVVPDSLSFIETAVGDRVILHQIVAQIFYFYDNSLGVNPNIYQTVNDTCGLTDAVLRAQPQTVADSLILSDDARRLTFQLLDSLSYTEVVTWAKGVSAEDSFTVISTVAYTATFIRPVPQTLSLGHALTYYLVRPCTDKQYSPFIGESTIPGLASPSTTLPAAPGPLAGVRFRLAYPAAGGAVASIILPAPQFENRDKIASTRISRETRGGKLSVYADPIWPQINTVACSFTGLTTTEVDLFQDFVATYIGLEINITDWEGREWVGVITGTEEPATHDGKDKWSIGFEFEGTLTGGALPGSSLALNEVVTHLVV